MEVLRSLDGPFDFVFMDAAKGQYPHYLPEVLRLSDAGGRADVGQCAAGRQSY